MRARDLIVHSSFKIDSDAIFGIMEKDFPILKDQIDEILESGCEFKKTKIFIKHFNLIFK
nr:hypothetical protein [uncultured archaeon]